MKAILITLAALAASVVAQVDLSKLPSCAMTCVQPMLSGADGCKGGEIACMCKSQTVQNNIGECLKKGCSAADQETAIQFASSLCKEAGVNIPTTIAAGTTSAPTAVTTTTVYGNITTATTNHTAPHTTSTGAAATGYIANGLGVAGAAVAGFFFL